MKGIGKPIFKFDPHGKPLNIDKAGRPMPTYISISEAARREGKHRSNIQNYLKHSRDPEGNFWKLAGIRP